MRITFVLPQANWSGGIRVPAIIAKELMVRGHEVHVVSAAPPQRGGWLSTVKSVARGRGWPTKASYQGSHLDGSGVPHHRLERWRPIEDADVPDADVVIGTWWETLEWVSALSPKKGAKVSFIQGYDPYFYEQGSPELLERAIGTWRLPARKIVVSRWLADLARDRFGDVTVSHVPNSVDTQQFYAEPRNRNSTPRIGLLYSSPRCKGLDVALEAVSIVRKEFPASKVVSFGSEPVTSNLPLPPGAEYTLRPPQNMIREIYKQCDVWLCGSRCEGFHLPPLEAMACRCPVVSTRVGGPVDIIENGENGYLVNIENPNELAKSLIRVLALPEQSWMQMSEAAFRRSRRYTWNDAVSLFEKALKDAVEHNSMLVEARGMMHRRAD